MSNLPSPNWLPFPVSGTDTGNHDKWLGKPFQGSDGNTYIVVKAGTGIITGVNGKACFTTYSSGTVTWTVNVSGTIGDNCVGWVLAGQSAAVASGTYFCIMRQGIHSGVYSIATGAIASGNGLYYVSSGSVATMTDNITGTLTGADFMSGMAQFCGRALTSATVLTGGGYVAAAVKATFGGDWG